MYKKAIVSTGVALLLGLGSYAFITQNQASSLETFLGKPEQEDAHFTEYLQFVATYGKTHYSHDEFYSRFKIFSAKVDSINAHNKLFEEAGEGAPEFAREVNQFAKEMNFKQDSPNRSKDISGDVLSPSYAIGARKLDESYLSGQSAGFRAKIRGQLGKLNDESKI